MPFTIPNELDAFHPNQAEPDKVDIDVLVAGLKGNGVISGCAVSAQGTPDMTVAVAVGIVKVDGIVSSVVSGNLTIGAADATNPRFDLIAVDSTGAKSVVAGTAASNPVFPAVPASKICLASVYVPANDTTIEGNQITDKRCNVEVSRNRNWLRNGSMEKWSAGTSSDPDCWVSAGTGATVAQQTSSPEHGSFYARISNSNPNNATLTQGYDGGADTTKPAGAYWIRRFLQYFAGKSITIKARVKCSVASRARLNIIDSGGTTNGTTNSGTGWETLTATRTIASGATSLQFQIETIAGTVVTTDIDRVWVEVVDDYFDESPIDTLDRPHGFEVVHPGESIQAAVDRVNARGGGEVILASGKHTITTQLTLRSGVTLRGALGQSDSSSVSRLFVGVAGIGVSMQSGSHLHRLHIEADTTVAVTNLIRMAGIDRASVRECHLGLGRSAGQSAGVYIIGPTNSTNILFQGNVFYSVGGAGAHRSMDVENVDNLLIVGNYFIPSGNADYCLGVPAVDVSGVIVGNVFDTGSNGISGISVAVSASPPSRAVLTIVGNTVLAGNTNANAIGIHVGLQDSSVCAVSVTGNVVSNFSGTSAIGIRTANAVAGVSTVTGNAARNCTTELSLDADTVSAGNV